MSFNMTKQRMPSAPVFLQQESRWVISGSRYYEFVHLNQVPSGEHGRKIRQKTRVRPPVQCARPRQWGRLCPRCWQLAQAAFGAAGLKGTVQTKIWPTELCYPSRLTLGVNRNHLEVDTTLWALFCRKYFYFFSYQTTPVDLISVQKEACI